MTEDISLLPLSLAGSTVSVCTKNDGRGKAHHAHLIIVDSYKKPCRLKIEWRDKKTGTYQFADTVNDFIIGLGGKPGSPTSSFKINWIPFPCQKYFTDEEFITLALRHRFIRKGYESIKRKQHNLKKTQDIILQKLDTLSVEVGELKKKQTLGGLSYDPKKVFQGLPKDAFQMEHMTDDSKWEETDETEEYFKKKEGESKQSLIDRIFFRRKKNSRERIYLGEKNDFKKTKLQ